MFVHPTAFIKLSKLSTLLLNSNQLRVVHSGWFASKTKFSSCQLSSNEISAVDSKLFDTWPQDVDDDFKGDLNLLGNKGMSLDLKGVSRDTSLVYFRLFYRSFFKYENNYYFNTLTCRYTIIALELTSLEKSERALMNIRLLQLEL